MNVLALNAGSSSLKVALFAIDAQGEASLARGEVERIAGEKGRLTLKDGAGQILADNEAPYPDHLKALHGIFDALDRASLPPADAVGPRFVPGGPDHAAPARVDAGLRASLAALVRFAPLHLPAELAVLDAAIAHSPRMAQVVCFDTAFHRTLPEIAERFALPRDLYDAGVRRYGFHGLSYEYIVETVGAGALGRAVIAHLGNGASMAAVKDGRSVDTTMGLTPSGGLVMGTRAGDLDPGIVVYLMDQHASGARAIEALVNERSGLLGVSGTSSDMKVLLDTSAHDARAALAVDIFAYTARKYVGALATVLEGLDTLVFTGGIGERAAPVRARICQGLGHLGVALDAQRNARADGRISPDNGACRVLVVPTDEERMIARHAFRLLS
jgi:acetate kinase